NEPFFNGHFPGHPVMPGVLVLEALAQACALLACKSEGVNPHQQVIYLMAIDNAKFRRPVVPGDRLQLEVEVIKHKGPVWKQKGVAAVDGAKVAEGGVFATLGDKGPGGGGIGGLKFPEVNPPPTVLPEPHLPES